MGAPLLPQLCFLSGMEVISLYKPHTAVTKSNIPHFFLGRAAGVLCPAMQQ